MIDQSVIDSVAQIVAISNGIPERASGFVVKTPSGRRVIISAAHVLKGGVEVSANFGGITQRSEGVKLDLVDYSDEMDLVAFVPHGKLKIPETARAFEVDAEVAFDHTKMPDVFMIGDPSGLGARPIKNGYINAPLIPANRLNKIWRFSGVSGEYTPRGKTMLVQHTLNSTKGFSGSPLLDSRGKVIGVQTGCVHDANEVSFAVAARHIFDLDLEKRADADFTKAKLALGKNQVTVYKTTSTGTVKLRNGNRQQIDSTCVDYGTIVRNAEVVADKFIADQNLISYAKNRVQLRTFLTQRSVSLVGNPKFGICFLVPNGNLVTTSRTDGPRGVRIRIGEDNDNSPDKVDIFAFELDSYSNPLEPHMREKVKDLVDGYPQLWLPPVAKGILGPNTVKKEMAIRLAAAHAEQAILGLSAKFVDENNYDRTSDNTNAYRKRVVSDFFPNLLDPSHAADVWIRVSYTDDQNGIAHVLRCSGWGNVGIIIHYQYVMREQEKFNAGKMPTNSFFCKRIIESSFSFY